MADVLGGYFSEDGDGSIFAELGVDWTSPWGPHLLASGGGGFISLDRSTGVQHSAWRVFIGLQVDLQLWNRDPTLSPRSIAGQ